ncbi:MAG: hypothetical protein AAF385_02725 [Pseudomonadota bacterium]
MQRSTGQIQQVVGLILMSLAVLACGRSDEMAEAKTAGSSTALKSSDGVVTSLDGQTIKFTSILSCYINPTLAGIVATQRKPDTKLTDFNASLRVTVIRQNGEAEAQILIVLDQLEYLYEGAVDLQSDAIVWSGDFLKYDTTELPAKKLGSVIGNGSASC